jgi:hypothetical protein
VQWDHTPDRVIIAELREPADRPAMGVIREVQSFKDDLKRAMVGELNSIEGGAGRDGIYCLLELMSFVGEKRIFRYSCGGIIY